MFGIERPQAQIMFFMIARLHFHNEVVVGIGDDDDIVRRA